MRSQHQIGRDTTPWRQRIVDSIPGGLFWVVCVASLISAALSPDHLFHIGAALSAYSALRFLLAAVASVIGHQHIHTATRTQWLELYRASTTPARLPWEAIHHIVIIPNYSEPLSVLEATLENLGCSAVAGQMTVVLAMEEREAGAVDKAQRLCQHYAKHFGTLLYTLHPSGLPGEIACKSANQNWAIRQTIETLAGQHAHDHIVVTTMDADTLWHADYFPALTYFFATDPQRHERFWQATIRYHANVWDVHPLIRLLNAYSSAFELAYLAGWWWQALPISSYSLSLRLLEACNYWDSDVIADDWHMYIKAFFARCGRVRVIPIYLPFLAYATTGADLWTSIRNRYQQTLRHAWGSKEIGYTVQQLFVVSSRPLVASLRLLVRVSHDLIFASTGWLLITLGTQLPLLRPDYREYLLTQPDSSVAFVVFQCSVVLVALIGLFIGWVDHRTRPARPAQPTWRERGYAALSYLVLPVLTAAFVTLPVIHAQTKLLIGMLLSFRVSPKL